LEAIGALFIVIGLLTAAAGLVEWRAARAAAAWPTADGIVLSAGTEVAEQRGRSLTYFDAVAVTYRYTAGGVEQTGDQIDLSGRPIRAYSPAGRDLLARLSPGAPVTVFFDPADPSRSILQNETTPDAMLAGGGLFLLGLFVLLGRRLIAEAKIGESTTHTD
jgi:hypothetical protein